MIRCLLTSVGAVGLAAVVLAGCAKNNAPYTPATPYGSPLAVVGTEQAYTTSVTDPEGDSVSVMFDWGGGDTSYWTAFLPPNRIVSMAHSWDSPETCVVRVMAQDVKGKRSEWSGGLNVAVVTDPPPDRPSAPSGPESTAVNSPCSFRASASDPTGDSIAIRFDWGNGDTSEWSDLTVSGGQVSGTYAWDSAGATSVRAQAQDAKGLVSAWSEPHLVAIAANLPPSVPDSILGPSKGGVNAPLWFRAAATDPEGDSIAIRFDWSDGDTSAWTRFYPSGSTPATNHSWGSNGVYQVRVQARDNRSGTSAWSLDHPVTISNEGTLRWRYQTGSAVTGSQAVAADGTIYVGSAGDKLTAVNPDGTRLWEYSAGDQGGFDSPALAADGTIYASHAMDGESDLLYALNPGGTRKWTFPVPSGYSPGHITVGDDGTVYVAAGGNSKFYAVNPDGSQKWMFEMGSEVSGNAAPPIAADGTAYCGGWWSSSLSAVTPSGSQSWSCYIDGGVESGPAIGADGTIYVSSVVDRVGGSQPSYLYAIRPGGSEYWSYQASGHIRCSPTIGADGSVYFGTQNGRLYALRADGSLKWDNSAGASIWTSSPVIDGNGVIYVGTSDRRLLAFDPDGTLRWTYTAGGPVGPLAIGPDGTIYFGSSDGYLYAVHGSGASTGSAWPMFQRDSKHTGRAGGK